MSTIVIFYFCSELRAQCSGLIFPAPCALCPAPLFIASYFHFNLFKLQFFLMKYMRLAFTGIFPCSHIGKLFIISAGLLRQVSDTPP